MLELSSFQLETIATFRADIGVCLNVTQNHLDRHHTFENYAAAKGNLFRTQQPGDYAVLNADDEILPVLAAITGRQRPGRGSAGTISAKLMPRPESSDSGPA